MAFGGLHVILTGDFHQFPPIAGEALYSRKEGTKETKILGGNIYQQFDTVVILEEQNRVTDQGWTSLLSRLRVGECTQADLKEIDKLVLSHPETTPVDFTTAPWNDAVLITSRNAVRDKWNESALFRHCKETGNQRYIVPAEDTSTEWKSRLG
ncbi:hypothetical protein CPB83DRAFT_861071 [Crepidotus variabilis]|uniref:ATP-dependent DNA helicase n=1 Tax=Crepidotus variabilis TaxID=179855 RepID=A0A9P6E910_9AGAR|nr:hypothetical protein CPB83DRAFT_861071 [Crepidotus variabilis]